MAEGAREAATAVAAMAAAAMAAAAMVAAAMEDRWVAGRSLCSHGQWCSTRTQSQDHRRHMSRHW